MSFRIQVTCKLTSCQLHFFQKLNKEDVACSVSFELYYLLYHMVWHHLWDPPLIECINVTFSVVKGHRSHSMCHILFQCCRPVDVYLYVAEMTPLSLSLIWRIALLQFGLRQSFL